MKRRSSDGPCSVFHAAVIVLAVSLCGGCTTRLARENVFANTESAFGFQIAENPHTQLYELKLGYARHELFYVPTSKLVFYDKGKGKGKEQAPDGVQNYNDPSQTPDVLAEIQVGGPGKRDGSRVTIYQRLAVGKNAVQSRAAVALMAGDAGTARVLAAINDPEAAEQRATLDELLEKELRADAECGGKKAAEFESTEAFADCLANEIAPGKTLASLRFFGGEQLDKLIERLRAAVKE